MCKLKARKAPFLRNPTSRPGRPNRFWWSIFPGTAVNMGQCMHSDLLKSGLLDLRFMKNLLIYVVVVYLGVGLYLYLSQRNFIYFPTSATESYLEETVFENKGFKIKASVLNSGQKNAIIYFGGNAENVDHNSTNFTHLFSDYTVYLVKYRGYGGSSGMPSEKAIYADALHIYDMISRGYDKVSVIGRSLGSGVATYVASKKAVDRLVLITPFDSVRNVAQSRFPIYPMDLLLTDKHDSLNRVKDIKANTLVIAAENDRVIEMKHTQKLVANFIKKVRFEVVEGTGHNDISSHPAYSTLLREFFVL